MSNHISILTVGKNAQIVAAEPVKATAPKGCERCKKPEPIISVYPGVPPYGTPEFFEFAKQLNEKLNS